MELFKEEVGGAELFCKDFLFLVMGSYESLQNHTI